MIPRQREQNSTREVRAWSDDPVPYIDSETGDESPWVYLSDPTEEQMRWLFSHSRRVEERLVTPWKATQWPDTKRVEQ